MGGALGQGEGLFKELHTVGFSRSSPWDAREEDLWVSAAPFPGFNRAVGRVTPESAGLAFPLQGPVRRASSCHLQLQKLEVHSREDFLLPSAIPNTQDVIQGGPFLELTFPSRCLGSPP